MTDEQIIEYLGMTEATEEGKKSLVETVRIGVSTRVGAILMESLSDEEYDQFEKLQAEGNDQVIWDWLAQVLGSDTRELYESLLVEYLDTMKSVL